MYTDAFHDKKNEIIRVIERNNGQRIIKSIKPDYHFFVDSPTGDHKSIFGNSVKKVVPTSAEERNKLSRIMQGKKYESDANLVFRCLEQNYQGAKTPVPNVAFFDIETDFDLVRGYSSPAEAFNPITSIAVYLQWLDQMVCLAVPPPTLSWDKATELANSVPDVILYKTEKEMLNTFIDLIDDADVISGWNCIDINEYVSTHDRLQQLKNIEPGTLLDDGKTKVKRYFDSGTKKCRVLKTKNGPELHITDEHVIPVYIGKDLDINNLPEVTELSVKQIRHMVENDLDDVYVSRPKYKNSNYFKDLSCRRLAQETNTDLGKIDLDLPISNNILYFFGYLYASDPKLSNKKIKFKVHQKEIAAMIFAALEDMDFKVDVSKLDTQSIQSSGYVPFSIDKNNKNVFYNLFINLISGTSSKHCLNVELLSLLSYNQFKWFFAGITDYSSYFCKQYGSLSTSAISERNNSKNQIQLLLQWNGIYTNSQYYLNIPRYQCNIDFIDTLPMVFRHRINERELSKSLPIDYSLIEDNTQVVTKIISFRSKYYSDIAVADIETESHYFICNGIKVHNSQAFDSPFIVNRIIKTLGKENLKRLSPLDVMPVSREVEKAGRKWTAYEFPGKVHLDYMELYKKYNYEEKSSYALNSIAEAELGETKVEYDGTLDQLYKNDFKKFLEYNIKDTYLLHRLDSKLKYIFIANQMAHDTCVLIPNVLATVAPTDNLLTMIAHNRGTVVPNRGSHLESRAAGGWVAKPKRGIHKFVGSTDLNSLYPSVIRSFNMSPETIIGQIDISGTWQAIEDHIAASKKNTFAGWWNDRFNPLEMEYFLNNDNYHKLKVKFEKGDTVEVTGAELRKLIFDSGQPWCISANGTIFRTDFSGLIPIMLTEKYALRKSQQKIERSFEQLCAGSDTTFSDYEHKSNFTKTQDEIYEFTFDVIKNDSITKEFLEEWGLVVINGKLRPRKDIKEYYENATEYWNKRQLVGKLLLNGTYGAILNPGCRFFDQRIGQSTTLSGRNITRHMTAKTNEMLCGVYDHYGKCVVYGDSVTPDTIIKTAANDVTIEELFNQGDIEVVNNREYSLNHDTKVLSFDPELNEPYFGSISHVYRHKTPKSMYKVISNNGKEITVTQDHSLMTYNNGKLEMKKPAELTNDDILLTLEYA